MADPIPAPNASDLAYADELARAAFEARGQLAAELRKPSLTRGPEIWLAMPEAMRAGYRVIALAVLRKARQLAADGKSPPKHVESPVTSPSPSSAAASTSPEVPLKKYATNVELEGRVRELEARVSKIERQLPSSDVLPPSTPPSP